MPLARSRTSNPDFPSGPAPPSAPIGIFDSGLGGLTVARAIIDAMPDENVIYIGDTGYGPYGPLTIRQVRERSLRVADDLVRRGVKALVIACNTASAACLRDARERYPLPVIEVILPTVRYAAVTTRNGRVGVIGTRVTIASGAYQDAFVAAPGIEVTAIACPRFVDLVESGVSGGKQLVSIAGAYLEPIRRARVDTLVLGCTHYPLLSRVIQSVVGQSVTLVSSSQATAKQLHQVLTDQNLVRSHTAGQAVSRVFEATGDPAKFAAMKARLFGALRPPVAAGDGRGFPGDWRA